MSRLDGFCEVVTRELAVLTGQDWRVEADANRIIFSMRDPSHKKDAPRIEHAIDFDPRSGVERDQVLARVREAV